MSSSYSPCAACKCLRRKCTNECVFAPYFPPDNPQKFTNVHKVFGASNVSKILNELNPSQRAEAVHSLAYEADCRLKDPVYGCVAYVSILQHRLKQTLNEIELAKKELATYIGPAAMLPVSNLLQQQQIQQLHNMVGSSVNHPMMPYEVQQHMLQMGQQRRGGSLVIREPQQQQQQQQQQQLIHQQQLMHQQQQQQQLQQILEAQQLAAIAASREQEMLRTFEQQQQLQLLRLNEGFEEGGPSTAAAGGINELPDAASNSGIEPSLALGGSHETNNPYHHHHHHQIEQQIQGVDQEQYSHSQSHSHSHSPYELLQQQHDMLLQQQQQQLLLATHQQLQLQQQLQQLTQPQASNSQQQQTPKENSGEDARSIGP